jgi:uncharacterized protein YkwD
VASARHAYTLLRGNLLRSAICAALLLLCVACCALASTAPAATLARSPRATRASSYASAPAKRGRRHAAGCARRASFHSSGGATHRRASSHGGTRRARSCGGRHHGRRRGSAHRHGAGVQTPPASGACANAQLQPTAENLELIDAATLCLVDRERTSRGEVALKPDLDLQRAAQAHSADMASGDYFAHDSRNGATPLARMRAAGYLPGSLSGYGRVGYEVGENIAWGTLWLATPKAIVAGWMASPGHRANILDSNFRDTGVGVAPHPISSLARGESGAIYTQDFGRIIAP